MSSTEFRTPDGQHTVSLEPQGARYAVWADDDFAGYVYPGVRGKLVEETIGLFGRTGSVLLYEDGVEVFLDGSSLRDGTDYAVRKNELRKASRVRTRTMICAGCGLLAAYVPILLFVDKAAELAGLPFVGAFFLIWGLARRSAEKKRFADVPPTDRD